MACPGSGLVELPLHLFGEGPAGHHCPAHELFGDLFGEGAAGALHSLGRHQHAVCSKKLSGQDTAQSTGLQDKDLLCLMILAEIPP